MMGKLVEPLLSLGWPILLKTISYSTRRTSARPRSFPPTVPDLEPLDDELFTLDSENDSLDELGVLLQLPGVGF